MMPWRSSRLSILWALALLIAPCHSSVNFLGWGADGGNVVVACGTTQPYLVGTRFEQHCIGGCGQVTYNWNPDLAQYGFSLLQGSIGVPASITFNPTTQAVAIGTLKTTISATDPDGTASGALTFTFNCPLRVGPPIPNQQATEGQLFSLNVSGYFVNPANHPITYTVEGLPPSSTLKINAQGFLYGTPTFLEAGMQQPLQLTLTATDTTNSLIVRSNTFGLLVAQKPGISFPSGLGPIPPQSGTENVLFQLAVARYFNNPSNFQVNWVISGGPLRIDPSTGIVSITPGPGELLLTKVQPIVATVTGTDERGNIATSNAWNFVVVPQKLVAKTVPYPLPSLVCGAVCCSWNVSDYVFNPSSNPLQVTSTQGLPASSMIRVLPDGTLTGVASPADIQASPITLIVSVNNGNPSPIQLPPMSFSVTPISAPTLSTAVFLNRTVKVGAFFQLDTSPYFVFPDSTQAPTWTMTSPSPSLSIDFKGLVSGTITERDYDLGSVLSFVVTVSNRGTCGGGATSKTFAMTLDPNWLGPTCTTVGTPQNFAVCEGNSVSRNFSQWCQDPKGLPLSYTISGLPNGTGLFFSQFGLLSGTVAPSPSGIGAVSLTVCATNTRGLKDCTQPFQAVFQRGKRPPIVDPPIPSPVTAVKGQRFVGYFNFHFYEPDWQPLIYSVAGLPVGSGLGIGPITGIFSGTPNEADFRASPLVVSVFASNEQNVVPSSVCQGQSQGGRARADLIIVVENPPSVPLCRPIPPPTMPAQTGQFWAMDVSHSFSVGAGATKLEYALRSLPRGSGLSIDPRSGIISGLLTADDAKASPLTLVVAVTNGYGACQSNVMLAVGSRSPLPLPTPPLYPQPVGPSVCPVNCNNIFIQNVNEGDSFRLDLKSFFVLTQNGVQLSFQTTGMPPSSGFTQDPYSGFFTGTPSQSDLAQASLLLVTSVSCGPGSQPVSKQWQLTISPRSCNVCRMNNGGCQQQCTVQNPRACAPTCGCNYGFMLNSDGRTCRAASTCDQNNGGCGSLCSGQGVCSCGSNWMLLPDKQNCGYNPCGSNNGGCEQICNSVGQQIRCDCRTGSLNPDGRTCSNQIITVGTIPPGLVIGCQQFIFDFSTAFRHAGGQRLSFTMTGLPPGTGFAMTPSGLLSGVPTNADCSVSQPMTISVTASYADASAHAVMFISAFCQKPNACQSTGLLPTSTSSFNTIGTGIAYSPPALVSPPGTSIPLLSAMVCVEFRFDVSPYFTGAQGDLQFSVLGLPGGSGFQLSSRGVLGGVPNDQDCSMSPMSLTCVARDSFGRESKSIITIRFSSCACVLQGGWAQTGYSTSALPPYSSANFISGPTITTTTTLTTPSIPAMFPVGPMPTGDSPTSLHIHNSATCGQPYFLDTAEYFRVNDLSFAVTGLPLNSGLRLSDSGVLSGTPNFADATAVNPLLVVVTATDRMGVSVILTVELDIQGSCGSLPAPMDYSVRFRSGYAQPAADANTGILPMQQARRGEYFRLDLDRIAFSSLKGKLQYGVTGLPPRSGLTISKAGLLAGIPNDADCSVSQPLKLNVSVSQSSKAETGFLVVAITCGISLSQPQLVQSTGLLPMASGVVGELFYYDSSIYFSAEEISFDCKGLPTDSLLQMNKKTGILSGILSDADKSAPPLLITARDKQGQTAQKVLEIHVHTKTNNTSPVFVPLDVLSAPVGRFFSLNIAQRFYDKENDVLFFSVKDLAKESGLKFDNTTGVLAGTPLLFDTQQQQPVRFIFYADDRKSGRTPGPVFLSFTQTTTTNTSQKQQKVPVISIGLNRDPVCLGIKRQTATESVPFLLGVSSSFVDQDGDVLMYRIDGLPEETGLSIDNSGLISGTPTQADAHTLQPLSLTVTVIDGQGGECSQIFLLTVVQGALAENHTPVAQQLPASQVYVGQEFIFRMSFSFADPDGDSLTYSISGLPKNTGIAFDSSSGVLSGTPSSSDFSGSPLSLVFVVDDGFGGVAKSTLQLTVLNNNTQKNRKPLVRAFPKVDNKNNGKVNFVGKDYFVDPDGDKLTFQIFGLQKESGLLFDNKTATVSGTPSQKDFDARQPLAIGIVGCDVRGECVGNTLFLTVTKSATSSATSAATSATSVSSDFVKTVQVGFSGVPTIGLEIGKWAFFPTSRFFPSSSASSASSASSPTSLEKVAFSASGLPKGGGLMLDPFTGVLYGTPNLKDLIFADSGVSRRVSVSVKQTDSRGGVVIQTLELVFSTSFENGGNHAPFARAIPQSRCEGGKMFLLDVWTSFADSDGDQLRFSVLGLPDNSGFSIVESSGVFFGIPAEADWKSSQPLVLTVIVNDQHGGAAQETLLLTVSPPSSNSSSSSSSSSSSPSSGTSSKTCEQLGWTNLPSSPVCINSKPNEECAVVSFAQASTMCAALGARLCSASELSESSFLPRSDCSKGVWSSSVCAFDGEVITQLGDGTKECRAKKGQANVQCCADAGNASLAPITPATVSRKTCDELNGFVTSPSSPNKAVCMSPAVIGGASCSGIVTFAKAVDICSKLMARVCTSDELSQDVGSDETCGYGSHRMWTSTECGQGQVVTQAGASASLRSVPKVCTNATMNFAVYCCADQKVEQFFRRLTVNSTKNTIEFSWEWKLYPRAQISFGQASPEKATWVTPKNGQAVSMGGPASFQLSGLQQNVRYAVRILPVSADNKFVRSQAVEFRATTLE